MSKNKNLSTDEFEKVTRVQLPFDMRHVDPSKNYGIGGLNVWFILKGHKGAVQYAVKFPVYLPHVEYSMDEIYGFDVGYHSPEPIYAGQSVRECDHLSAGKCYYDGSSYRAREWTKEIFSVQGRYPDDVLWEKLEEFYYEIFESK
jgi:hypothetical protein